MSIIAARKQLQNELKILGRQTLRIETALQALKGTNVALTPRKKFKMSPEARRRISDGIKKAKAAKLRVQR